MGPPAERHWSSSRVHRHHLSSGPLVWPSGSSTRHASSSFGKRDETEDDARSSSTEPLAGEPSDSNKIEPQLRQNHHRLRQRHQRHNHRHRHHQQPEQLPQNVASPNSLIEWPQNETPSSYGRTNQDDNVAADLDPPGQPQYHHQHPASRQMVRRRHGSWANNENSPEIRSPGSSHHIPHSRRKQQHQSQPLPHTSVDPHYTPASHGGQASLRQHSSSPPCHWHCATSSQSQTSGGSHDSGGLASANNNSASINVEVGSNIDEPGWRLMVDPRAMATVCGSDGRLYGSMCELKLKACQLNKSISRMPRIFCSNASSLSPNHTIDAGVSPLNRRQKRRNSENSAGDEGRIVNLRQRCNHDAYMKMKLLLLSNFSQDMSAMFEHFDSNADGRIEAHELWPRNNIESNKLVYAQVWDEHTSKCYRTTTLSPLGVNSSDPAENSTDDELAVQSKKCWYFLDFAFEPRFVNNPCSLSHLMLFDLDHLNNHFTRETFELAFANLTRPSEEAKFGSNSMMAERSAANSAPIGGHFHDLPIWEQSDYLHIKLGDQVKLDCSLNASLMAREQRFIAPIGNKTVRSQYNGDSNRSSYEYGYYMNDSDDHYNDNASGNGGISNGANSNDDAVTTSTLNNGEHLIECLWNRYDINLASLRDPHIFIRKRVVQFGEEKLVSESTLHLYNAQLYLSGHFTCQCNMMRDGKVRRTLSEHLYSIRVSAEPRVDVRPRYQWSLPRSRIAFECNYDYIDTSFPSPASVDGDLMALESANQESIPEGKPWDSLEQGGQFGLRVEWLRDNGEIIIDKDRYRTIQELSTNQTQGLPHASFTNDHPPISSPRPIEPKAKGGIGLDAEPRHHNSLKPKLSQSSERATITMASSRLVLENLTISDSGHHTCRVYSPNTNPVELSAEFRHARQVPHADTNSYFFGQGNGTLLVQDQRKSDQLGSVQASNSRDAGILAKEMLGTYLWMFHENGISIYRLQNDDGQEMEVVREINGHSVVSAEVDGNWNQLTLCGGLNSEQAVICEWSDNALHVDVNHYEGQQQGDYDDDHSDDRLQSRRRYVYVGQPNLNRVIVMDGHKFEILAIINTEPQPRKLYLYKPNKIHLSKWVRRRLSPLANARWLSAIGTHAHSLKSTPDSRLYSENNIHDGDLDIEGKTILFNGNNKTSSARAKRRARDNNSKNKYLPPLIQYDIWLLCYGQPLVVDPSGDENSDEMSGFYPTFSHNLQSNSGSKLSSTNTSGFSRGWPSVSQADGNVVQPFTPRLSAGPPMSWSVWSNKESKLRNRKSVHIIQSTFFSRPIKSLDGNDHTHQQQGDHSEEPSEYTTHRSSSSKKDSVVNEFKRSTVLTTHHVVVAMPPNLKNPMYFMRPRFDLIQDLSIPSKPFSLENNHHHRIHYAYVTHYNDRRLFRVSMDRYHYDKEIDLQNCDPIDIITVAQGLIVVQCRAPIAHDLIGQLVLDQLTDTKVEFNDQIKAQKAYLSPDNRYLVSIFTNSSHQSQGIKANHNRLSEKDFTNNIDDSTSKRFATDKSTPEQAYEGGQSIIYVQLVTVSGLRLQYEIKTTLEISQCSFVWKDGYYAAILVSTNRREKQSEIFSLRLLDSRLQLMARVPGLINSLWHKDQLIVSSRLRLAALSTNQGTYVVDLEDNRVSQSLRRHQSRPTLLWV